MIRSNTRAGRFVDGVLSDRPREVPPEHGSLAPALARARGARSTRALSALGDDAAPLQLVGNFLRELGGGFKVSARIEWSVRGRYESEP